MNDKACDCGSTNIERHNNIGHNVDPDGEENQHLDVCCNCHSERIVTDFCSFDGKKEHTFYGKWYKPK